MRQLPPRDCGARRILLHLLNRKILLAALLLLPIFWSSERLMPTTAAPRDIIHIECSTRPTARRPNNNIWILSVYLLRIGVTLFGCVRFGKRIVWDARHDEHMHICETRRIKGKTHENPLKASSKRSFASRQEVFLVLKIFNEIVVFVVVFALAWACACADDWAVCRDLISQNF